MQFHARTGVPVLALFATALFVGAAGAFVDWEYVPELFGGAASYQINLTGCVPCEAAVAGEQSAWGELKSSYR
jgi:hypothetical protein